MKKVIGGKRYDTETAKEMGYDYYGTPRDFNHWTETLYRKRTGEYFLHGEGGPNSKYSQSIGQNEWSGGEQIQPLSVESAQKWAEEHLSGEEYEQIFGEIEEDDTKKITTYSLPLDALDLVERYAAEHQISKSAVVETAIRNLCK